MTKDSGEKQYKITKVVKRMLENMKVQDAKQFGRIAVYTIMASIYPFFAVLLPKLAIGILEQGGENAGKNLVAAMAGYLLGAGMIGFLMNKMMYDDSVK